MALYAIIRLRGEADVPKKVEDTLKMLRLHRVNHLVLYPKSDSIDGMLKVVKDWVTWGEIDKEVLKELIIRRGRLVGNKRLSEDKIKEIFKVGSIDDLADKLINGDIRWHEYDDVVKPVFRLHPPKGGFKRSKKKPYRSGGELGYRGSDINLLLKRMI